MLLANSKYQYLADWFWVISDFDMNRNDGRNKYLKLPAVWGRSEIYLSSKGRITGQQAV